MENLKDSPPSQAHFNRQEREPERMGESVAEPDAPSAAEENEGMSTILSGNPMAGVQDDASEK